MKMKWLIVVVLCVLVSCKEADNKYIQYINFPVEKELTAQVISLDTALFRYPFRISIKDSVAIVLDLHNIDNYFHAFSYPDFKHIVSFGRRGEGPDEMLSAETIRFNSLDSIWTVDANKMQINRWSISPSTRIAQRKEIISLDKQLIRALEIACVDDSTFLIPDYTGSNRYSLVGRDGKMIRQGGSIPTQTDYSDTSLPAMAQAWRSFIGYNPSNGVLAMATQLGEVLEIYHLNDTISHVKYGPKSEPQFRISGGYSIPVGIMGFSDIKMTDRYIYVVFHGRTFKELMNQKEPRVDGGKYIYVFDLTGEPVCKYTLDHYIYGINVDEQNGVITAVDVNSDQPILQYKL